MNTLSRLLRRPFALAAALALLAGAAWADPPARVGRLAWIAGDVTLRADPGAAPTAASLNWPVTGGTVLDTGPSGRAELTLGATALRLDVNSEVEVEQLDDQQLRLRLNRGTLALRSATPADAGGTAVDTPLGQFRPAEPGSFRLDLNGPGVEATAWRGQLGFNGGGSALTVLSGQHAQLQPAAAGVSMAVLAPVTDDFMHFVQARDAAFTPRVSTQYVSPEMTGIESLDRYGHWQQSPEYGSVWVPDVAAGWAPYREGRWAWVAPWGWTWIDAAPWGFAPFHYGRWALWGDRWAWVPGSYVARPVYAPALVAWNGPMPAAGVGVSATIRLGAGVGWFPLAPHEVYVPPYAVSASYVRNVNITHVTNVVEIDRVVQTTRQSGAPGAAPPARHFAFQAEPRALTTPAVMHASAGRPEGAPARVPPVPHPAPEHRLAEARAPHEMRPPPEARAPHEAREAERREERRERPVAERREHERRE